MADHDDITQLIEAGRLDAARDLFATRDARGGVSGHDRQTITAQLEKASRPRPEPQRTPRRETRVELDKDPDASGQEG